MQTREPYLACVGYPFPRRAPLAIHLLGAEGPTAIVAGKKGWLYVLLLHRRLRCASRYIASPMSPLEDLARGGGHERAAATYRHARMEPVRHRPNCETDVALRGDAAMKAMLRIAAAMTFSLAALTGCANDTSSLPPVEGRTNEQQIRDIYAQLTEALERRNGAAACETMTVAARAETLAAAALLSQDAKSCAEAAESLARLVDANDLESDLIRIAITGAKATAADDEGETQTFARVAGRWLNDDSSDDKEEQPSPTPAKPGDTCDKLGINRARGREGRCIANALEVDVANPGHIATIKGLRARLLDTRARHTIKPEFDELLRAEGRFYVVRLELTNTGTAPANFTFSASLGESDYELAEEATLALGGRLTEPLGAGLTRRGPIVFDVAPNLVAEIKRTGNVGVQVDGDDGAVAILRTYNPN